MPTDAAMTEEQLDRPAMLRDLRSLEQRFEIRFEQIDRRFEQIDLRFKQIDRRFEQIDRRFEQIDERFEQIDRRFEQIDQRFDDVKRHFDVVAEQFKIHFDNLFDWTLTTTSALGARLDSLETTQGARLTKLEARVSAVEGRRRRK